ncbi:putative metallophosphoesterase YhaO [Thalassoglobus neptunius]|uniref:Putative metallophosphoesterase YhaO n=1 Tax=Thalassoglobus neptunius TaxID=1938619 RepID=A0A5C5VZ86_9PLAN|nr:hypothetical protein [Thalassoglobus neptunius]TWT43089.1 putative metallophosphoesterase YhaO [Thalassoglobus neptunius]
MADEGFRFIHATDLRLDEPLVGVGANGPGIGSSGKMSGDESHALVDATLTAWNLVVEHCVSAQADFLLLTGNVFDHRSLSLRARIALERGLATLDSNRIEVFIAPGNLDPATAWKRQVSLPGNVSLLGTEESDPVAVVKHGRMLTSIQTLATTETEEPGWNANSGANETSSNGGYRIGVVPAGVPVQWKNGQPESLNVPGASPFAATLVQSAIENGVNYVACGAGQPQLKQAGPTWIHDPGPTQSIRSTVAGPCGCSLVQVDSHGRTRIDSLALAPVRWETFFLEIEKQATLKDVVEKMALQVMELNVSECEDVWVLNWRLSGEGKTLEAFLDPSQLPQIWEQLEEELEEELSGDGHTLRIHQCELVQRVLRDPVSLEDATGLIQSLQELLESEENSNAAKSVVEEVRRELIEDQWLQRADMFQVREVIASANSEDVIQRALDSAGLYLD